MNNIYDLFNDRKSGIEAIYENANNDEVVEESVEETSEGFESIEEAVEYMDNFILESTDEAIEFQAACYLENLVLEQMMYEDFNEEEMQLTIEGAMKERMARAGEALKEMWRKVKEWFNNVINNLVNHFTSGKKLVEKYGAQKIINAMKDCETQVKMNEYGDLAKASNAVAWYVNKLSELSLYATPDRNKILDAVQAESVNAAAEKIRKLYITSDKPVVKKIREINGSQAINVCSTGGDFVKHLKDWRNQIDKSFNAMLGQMNRKDNGDYMANAKFGATLRNKIVNEAIKCVNKITREYRAIIIKALGKNGKDDVIKAKGEVVDDKPDREVKGALGDGSKPGQKALGQGNYVAASWSDFDDDYEYMEEGIKDTIVTAKDKAKGKLNDMKEKHGEKKGNHKVAKKEKQIEKLRNKIEARKADYAKLEKEKENIDGDIDMLNDEIAELMQEIEAIKNQLAEKKAVAQESFFYDESEIEALEESLKEKMGQFNEKIHNKINDLVVGKDPKKLRELIEREQAVIDKLEAVREERGEDGDAKFAKFKNIVVASAIANALTKQFEGKGATNKWISKSIKSCKMLIAAAERKLAKESPEGTKILVNLSGRGDKDLDFILKKIGH